MEVNGAEKRLVGLTGACQAEDVKLELSVLTFGDVCESCSLTRKVQIQNAGDLRARFRFEIDRFRQEGLQYLPYGRRFAAAFAAHGGCNLPSVCRG